MMYLKRADSICPDPAEVLLTLVKENDIEELKNLIRLNGNHLLSKRYGSPYTKRILPIACFDFAEYVEPATINTLIELGADLNCPEETWKEKTALHFAALGKNPEILRNVIKNLSINGINTLANENTALHLIIKEGNPADPEDPDFLECVKILLEHGINIKTLDKTNSKALYWAAKKKYSHVVELIIERDNNCSDKEANFINKLNLGLELNINNDENESKSVMEKLIYFLNERDEESFITFYSQSSNVDDKNCEETFLEIACEKKLEYVVDYLVNCDDYYDKLTKGERKWKNGRSPLFIAASDGNCNIFKTLIEKPQTKIDDNVLPEILKKLDYDKTFLSDYPECFRLLMENGNSVDVNFRDKSGNYPLHYGARYGGPQTAMTLLNYKASLANKNKYGFLTVAEVDYESLRDHFDSCIDAQPCNKLDKENMTITFDYETLLPSRKCNVEDNDDKEALNGNKSHRIMPECEAVYYMSKSSELKTLLKHPLITSFLYMKWYRIRWIFYLNLLLYILFCLSLLLYTLVYYNTSSSAKESSVFYFMFLLITTFILIIRETFQITVAPKKYFSNFENYLEIALIIVVLYMLFDATPSDKTKKQLCAIAFLLAAFEFLFLMGNYPDLSTNIVMLRTVSLNFFKFFLFYSILIVAFAFCFHTLFNNEHAKAEQAKSNNGTEEEDDGQEFFVNPFLSMFKTIIMLTGEFEAGEINFDQYPVISHLIFLLFVVTIAVILLNLLNGLAVSDTQEIKNEAELVGHIARAQYIAYAESMIFGNIQPTMLINIYNKLFSCKGTETNNKIKPKRFTKQICLYPDFLQNYKLTVYPNQKGRIHFENKNKSNNCSCKNVFLDNRTIRKARNIIQERKEQQKRENQSQRILDNQEKLLLKLDNLINNIKLNQH